MRIELAAWESTGLRCPDVSIDLRRHGSIQRVSLIQMPNGTGKTTTLELLNATLSGSASGWDHARVRSYRRSGDQATKGRFCVTLLLNGKPLSIELVLDYETGDASYLSTSPGSGGVERRWYVPPAAHRFLTPEFLGLFIFDGEFAGKLLDGNHAEADRVVDALCQIYMLDDVAEFAQVHWENAAKRSTTKTSAGLAKHVDTRDGLVTRLNQIKSAHREAAGEAGQLAAEIRHLQEKVDARLNSVESTRERHEQARLDLEVAQSEVSRVSASLMAELRWPHALHIGLSDQLNELRDNLDRLRLPENTSAQFFEELLHEDECICGRPMSEAAKAEITQRASRYLDADDAGIINALKRDIGQFTIANADPQEDAGHFRVQRLSEELRGSARQARVADQQLRSLARQLIQDGDDELAAWQQEHRQKQSRLNELTELIASIESPGQLEDDETTMSLARIEKMIREKNAQIAEIRGTVELRHQTEKVADLLNKASERARARIKSELLEQCNERLANILVNDPLRIDRIDKSIHLRGQVGASAGQTLSIGYTFLMSVLNRGQNDFPLVVDSPAGPIDEGVRRRIGRLLPSLCSQFVGFTINTERAGFVESLESKVQDTLFLTMFRKTPGTEHMMASLPKGRYSETENCVLVDDRGYFFGFDIEDEEEEE